MLEHKTPFLWSGSKDKNWSDIKRYIPKKIDSYVEPFLGGGSIYFRLLNSHNQLSAKLSDVNSDLINCYKVIQTDVQYLADNLPTTKDKDVFQHWLQTDKTLSNKEKALRFLYLNRNRFFGMGGWMTADRYARDAVISRILFFSDRMKNTKFFGDAFQVPITEKDFVFVDPPYPSTNNRACYNISDEKILDLNLKFLSKLNDIGCQFLFITKNVKEVKKLTDELVIPCSIKEWKFRKPGKSVQFSEELWIHKTSDSEKTSSPTMSLVRYVLFRIFGCEGKIHWSGCINSDSIIITRQQKIYESNSDVIRFVADYKERIEDNNAEVGYVYSPTTKECKKDHPKGALVIRKTPTKVFYVDLATKESDWRCGTKYFKKNYKKSRKCTKKESAFISALSAKKTNEKNIRADFIKKYKVGDEVELKSEGNVTITKIATKRVHYLSGFSSYTWSFGNFMKDVIK